jgi:coenzyme F420-reducing hydrogenase gamma subunit
MTYSKNVSEELIKFLSEGNWEEKDKHVIREFLERFLRTQCKQECRFCLDENSILTKETCCTGCSKLVT